MRPKQLAGVLVTGARKVPGEVYQRGGGLAGLVGSVGAFFHFAEYPAAWLALPAAFISLSLMVMPATAEQWAEYERTRCRHHR